MELFCFLILHYNSIEDTEKCITSIKKLNLQDQIRILVVDNHSPNGTGKILFEEYKNDPKIKVIITEDNYGFSKGNNIGCSYAVERWNPDYLIVSNNDIIFPQHDFLNKIHNSDMEYSFDVLGPDIYDPFTNKHQNPMDSDPPTAFAAIRTITLNSLALLKPGLILPILKKRVEESAACSNLNYDVPHHIVVLQVSCLIYSKSYLKDKMSACNNCLFYPETTFFYEEYIQALWCRRNQNNLLYNPDLLVHHMGGRATDLSHNTDLSKIIFRMKNIRDSAKVYLSYYLRKNI